MRTVKIPELDKPWSVITFGCWQIAPSGGWGDYCTPKDADRVVKTALEGGITAFDTAEGYGDGESERRLSKALGPRLDDVIIISKIWPDAELTPAAYQKRLDQSLKALRRDFVDVYLVHWPSEMFGTAEHSRRLVDLMVGLRESGKARTVGLSNFRAEDLKRLGPGASEFVVNQVPYHLLQREYEDETLEICRRHGIRYMAYSPTGRGFFGGRLDEKARQYRLRQGYFLYQEPYFSRARPALELLEAIAREAGTSAINVALAWVLAQSDMLTAVVGSRRPEQVREVCAAGDLRLSPDQLARLNQVSEQFHQALAR